MRIEKTCWYGGVTVLNLLPAVLLVPLRECPEDETYHYEGPLEWPLPVLVGPEFTGRLVGFRLAFKWWSRHAGIEIRFE